MTLSIAIALPNLAGGGAERLSLVLAREFEAAGHPTRFVVLRDRGELVDEARGIADVVSLDVDRIREVPTRLAAYLREQRPDVLIANLWPLTSAATVARSLSAAPTRVAVVDHNPLSHQYANWGQAHRLALRTSLLARKLKAHA